MLNNLITSSWCFRPNEYLELLFLLFDIYDLVSRSQLQPHVIIARGEQKLSINRFWATWLDQIHK